MAIEIFKITFEGTLSNNMLLKNLHGYKIEKIYNVLRFDF